MSWVLFWVGRFVGAVGAFGLISLVIAVRGVAEIRDLFSGLERETRRNSSRRD